MDQEFINQLAEKLSKLGTKRPLGFHYAHPFGTVPPDSIICNGAEYNRALYADFFAYATEQGWVKTESEWQSIASQNNGYCSYYSDGDGSTTFRTPKFAPFMQVAIASGNVGNYHQAGLPNITGSVSVSGGDNDLSRTTGTLVSKGALTASSLSTSTHAGYYQYAGINWSKLSFSASDSDKTYGRSSTVQPESNEWMICVVVFGVATNVGSADVGNVMSAVAQVQGDVSSKLPNSTPHIVDTWSSGSDWYRVWSDGWIEQGGVMAPSAGNISRTTSFNKNFKSPSTVYVFIQSCTGGSPGGVYHNSFHVSALTTTGFTGKNNCEETIRNLWHACGY